MPTGALLNKMRTDRIVAARAASAPPHEQGPAGRALRAVPDLPGPAAPCDAPVPAVPAAPAVDLTGAVFGSARFDGQGRASARTMLAAVGWDSHTALVSALDRAAGVVWLRDAAEVAARGGTAPSCRCEGCDHPAPLPALPGQLEDAFEVAHLDAKRQLVLPRGLAHAVGLQRPARAALVAFPRLEALAVVALNALLGSWLKDLAPHPTSLPQSIHPSG
jgi:hypothetical protein